MRKPLVGIVMGSQNDWDVMQHAARQLKDFGIPYEARALSAHRTPDLLTEWIEGLEKHGVRMIDFQPFSPRQLNGERLKWSELAQLFHEHLKVIDSHDVLPW